MQRDGSDSSINLRPVSQIVAWKQPNSIHRDKLKDKILADIEQKKREEKDEKTVTSVCDCREILGLADMSSKNEAKDFAAKAVRKH